MTFQPHDGHPIRRDLGIMTDHHEERGEDPNIIAQEIARYLAAYVEQRGVPLGYVLNVRGKIG